MADAPMPGKGGKEDRKPGGKTHAIEIYAKCGDKGEGCNRRDKEEDLKIQYHSSDPR